MAKRTKEKVAQENLSKTTQSVMMGSQQWNYGGKQFLQMLKLILRFCMQDDISCYKHIRRQCLHPTFRFSQLYWELGYGHNFQLETMPQKMEYLETRIGTTRKATGAEL